MLVNVELLKDDDQTYNEMMEIFPSYVRDQFTPINVSDGVYQCWASNFEHQLQDEDQLLPFIVGAYGIISVEDIKITTEITVQSIRLNENQRFRGVQSYGVSDTVDQILSRYSDLLNHPTRRFVVSYHEVWREHQETIGGWRFHKWGEYIGTKTITHEYLYDEHDIDCVLCFDIHELKS